MLRRLDIEYGVRRPARPPGRAVTAMSSVPALQARQVFSALACGSAAIAAGRLRPARPQRVVASARRSAACVARAVPQAPAPAMPTRTGWLHERVAFHLLGPWHGAVICPGSANARPDGGACNGCFPNWNARPRWVAHTSPGGMMHRTKPCVERATYCDSGCRPSPASCCSAPRSIAAAGRGACRGTGRGMRRGAARRAVGAHHRLLPGGGRWLSSRNVGLAADLRAWPTSTVRWPWWRTATPISPSTSCRNALKTRAEGAAAIRHVAQIFQKSGPGAGLPSFGQSRLRKTCKACQHRAVVPAARRARSTPGWHKLGLGIYGEADGVTILREGAGPGTLSQPPHRLLHDGELSAAQPTRRRGQDTIGLSSIRLRGAGHRDVGGRPLCPRRGPDGSGSRRCVRPFPARGRAPAGAAQRKSRAGRPSGWWNCCRTRRATCRPSSAACGR